MFGLFTKKKAPTSDAPPSTLSPGRIQAAPADASAGGIAFYPGLIPELVDDHRQLEALRQRVKNRFEARDLGLVARELKAYGALLRNHLLKENMRLYIYLQQRVAGDDINTELVRSFRKEMNGIARQGLDFLDKYEAIETLPAGQLVNFIAEIDRIGAVVNERMHREEQTLYPLYAPAY